MSTWSKSAYRTARGETGFSASFEFFPPATQRGLFRLLDHVIELQAYEPEFVSITYGAGGSATTNTLRAASSIVRLGTVPVAGHLTCAGASRDETHRVLETYSGAGIKRIVALRGDGPAGGGPFAPHRHGYRGGVDLVKGLRARTKSAISVAAYPETHPDAASHKADIDALKAKFDAGADSAITQMCFDNTVLLKFFDRLAARGIDQPVVPGILLIHDFWKMRRFAKRCGTTVPNWLAARFEGLENDPEGHRLAAVGIAIEQVLELAAHGVRRFHFYTFNRSELAVAVCRSLGMMANPQLRWVA